MTDGAEDEHEPRSDSALARNVRQLSKIVSGIQSVHTARCTAGILTRDDLEDLTDDEGQEGSSGTQSSQNARAVETTGLQITPAQASSDACVAGTQGSVDAAAFSANTAGHALGVADIQGSIDTTGFGANTTGQASADEEMVRDVMTALGMTANTGLDSQCAFSSSSNGTGQPIQASSGTDTLFDSDSSSQPLLVTEDLLCSSVWNSSNSVDTGHELISQEAPQEAAATYADMPRDNNPLEDVSIIRGLEEASREHRAGNGQQQQQQQQQQQHGLAHSHKWAGLQTTNGC